MEKTRLSLLISRALQFLLAIVILSISIAMYKDFKAARPWCELPRFRSDHELHQRCKTAVQTSMTAFGFASCVGGLGVVDAILGVPADFIDIPPWVGMVAADGTAAMFYLAAGICLAVTRNGNFEDRDGSKASSQRWTTVNVLCFFALVVTLGAAVQVFLRRTTNKSSTSERNVGVAML